jgi:hypothetical protein
MPGCTFRSTESARSEVQAQHQAGLLQQVRKAPTRWFLAFVDAPALLELAGRRADAPIGTQVSLSARRRGGKRRASRHRALTAKLYAHRRGEGAYTGHYSRFEVHNMPRNRTDAGEASYDGASSPSAAYPTEESSPVIFWVKCPALRIRISQTASRYCVHWILL